MGSHALDSLGYQTIRAPGSDTRSWQAATEVASLCTTSALPPEPIAVARGQLDALCTAAGQHLASQGACSVASATQLRKLGPRVDQLHGGPLGARQQLHRILLQVRLPLVRLPHTTRCVLAHTHLASMPFAHRCLWPVQAGASGKGKHSRAIDFRSLAPWLSIGCISPRQVYSALNKHMSLKQARAQHGQSGPDVWEVLLLRDFSFTRAPSQRGGPLVSDACGARANLAHLSAMV